MSKNFILFYYIQFKDLSHNSLTSIAKSFGWLIKLIKLNLSSNMINQLIPEAFYSTSNFYFIYKTVQHFSFSLEIKYFHIYFKDLKIIDLSENQIQELPVEIGELMHLEQLFCRQNKLKKLPKLAKCCKLKDWDLSFNGNHKNLYN